MRKIVLAVPAAFVSFFFLFSAPPASASASAEPPTGSGGVPGDAAASGPAVADPASFTDVGVARLSVTLDDGTESVTEGQRVTYTVTVANDGGTTYRDARVSHVLPPGVRLRSAVGADTIGGGEVIWRVSLTPGESRALTVTADVVSGELTATACVAPAPGRPLASCASDSDAYAASPARRAWAAVATIALTGIVVTGGALLLWRRASLDSRHRSGKAAR